MGRLVGLTLAAVLAAVVAAGVVWLVMRDWTGDPVPADTQRMAEARVRIRQVNDCPELHAIADQMSLEADLAAARDRQPAVIEAIALEQYADQVADDLGCPARIRERAR
jgi:hypothetical protein